MILKFIVTIVFGGFVLQSNAQLKWPVITQEMKPWTRWWWEGSAVNKKDLTWNLEKYKAAGLGGVEITPIYGVVGHEKKFIPFLSPQWLQMLQHTLTESKRLNLGVDLANATGWPFGGPWTTDADASKAIYYKTYVVNGGEQLPAAVEYPLEGMVRTANNKQLQVAQVQNPLSKNPDLQALALDQIIFPRKLPIQALMAYSDKGAVLDLTGRLDARGRLDWTAPAGKWTLYALFVGLHGKMVERAAPGGEGYAIDHFSLPAATNYFKRFDEAFKGFDLSYLRAFFNDSYEVDDARGQANWTTQLLTEFKKRRGYDLVNHLPALFGKDVADKNSRVLYDYRATIDELLLEYFTVAWKKWGAAKGALVRNQSHGSPANTLDLYGAVDIPETEGTDILRFKFATSAANVTGKKLVSSESATWLNEHFLSSWGDVKKAIDLYFLGGVNHIFYHGTAYSPQEAPWPGWLFYAAVQFQPTNPQWKDFGTLNEYVARVQSFLQQGKPDNDVLLYYPIVDRYSETGGELLQHFDGMERNFERTDFEHVSKWMLDKGYGFDFFSDRQLQNISTSGGQLETGGNQYQTILLPANKLMKGESFQKLIDLARNGAQIIVYKNLPQDVPGFGELDQRRTLFHQLTSQLVFAPEIGYKRARVGKGAFFMGDDLNFLLGATKARRETASEKGVSSVRRKNSDGYTYFFNNRTANPINEWISLTADATTVGLFDAMSGKTGLGRWKKTNKGTEVFLQLQPYESIIVQTYTTKKNAIKFPYWQTASEPQTITGQWTVEFLNGGPDLLTTAQIDKLASWTEWGGDKGKNFSGTAQYSIKFERPAGNASAWLLNLGSVHETAQVLLNGKKMATLIGPVFQVTIPSSGFNQTNTLEVTVSNLMANRIAYMDRNNLPWKIFYNTNMPARRRENAKNGLFDASSWAPLPSGLLGPVTLTAVKYE